MTFKSGTQQWCHFLKKYTIVYHNSQWCSCKKISGETLVTLVNGQHFFSQVIRKIFEKISGSRKFFKNLVRDAIIEPGMQFGTCYRLAHLLARSFNTVQGSASCNINRDDI